jgi:type IV secretion system protein VirD4
MYLLCRIILIAFVVACGCALCFLVPVLGGGLSCLLLFCGLVWAARKRKIALTAFGTARWCGTDELLRIGIVGGSGLILGRPLDTLRRSAIAEARALFNPSVSSADASNRFLRAIFPRMKQDGNYVRLSNAVHTAVFAPTGTGKGVSCVIPFLLDCPESCVFVDFKGENALLTMKQRRRMGHRVVLLDPYKMVTDQPDTFNPLDFIDKRSPHVIDEIRDLAESLVIRNPAEKEPHWADSAETWISAAMAAVVEYGDADDRSLQTVRDLLSAGPDKLQLMIKLLCESEACQGMVSRLGYQLTNFKEKELASTLTTVNRYLRNLDTPAIAASTKTSTFDPSDLLKGEMTLFLVLPPDHARTQSPLLRTWISTLLRAVVRGGLQERTRVHFLLDEAASLGHLESLDDAVDKYRGYGVRLTFIYQSLGQLKKCFPEGQDTTLLSNVTQVFFGVNEPQTAEYVSNRLGEATIIVKSGGVSRGTSQQYSNRDSSGSYSTSQNGNDNWQQQGRKLLRPEEVMALPPRMAITFVAGMPPIRTWLIRHYEERPSSALRRLLGAVRAIVLSTFLLAVGAIAAKQAQSMYEYQVQHPPVRMVVPNRRVPLRR